METDNSNIECGFGYPNCAGKSCPNWLSVSGIACLHRVFHPPDLSKMKSHEQWAKELHEKYLAEHENKTSFPEKRLVFADKEHASVYDSQYQGYLESLGEQAKPSPTEIVGTGQVEFTGNSAFGIVGHGPVTNKNCGRFLYYQICSHPELHNITTLEGGNFRGKTAVHFVFHHCDSYECPICYSKGWAFREAQRITQRIKAASQGFTDEYGVKFSALGLAEHIVISVPSSDYGLPYEKLKAKVLKIAYSRGIIGGSMVFHPFRYRKFDVFKGGIRNMRGFYFSPHFHVIGFFASHVDYGKCRSCPKMKPYEYVTGGGKLVKRVGNSEACKGCSGFENLCRKLAWGDTLEPLSDGSAGTWLDVKGKLHKGDKYIVKVMEKRKSIFGTAWYELNHAGYRIGAKRFHPATWFGACNSNKLRVTAEFRKQRCPICNSEMVAAKYLGSEIFERFDFYCATNMIVNLYETDKDGNRFLAWVEDLTPKKQKFG
jgi:uncharacterized protein with PIN domain